jgi:hypothetical protein
MCWSLKNKHVPLRPQFPETEMAQNKLFGVKCFGIQ